MFFTFPVPEQAPKLQHKPTPTVVLVFWFQALGILISAVFVSQICFPSKSGIIPQSTWNDPDCTGKVLLKHSSCAGQESEMSALALAQGNAAAQLGHRQGKNTHCRVNPTARSAHCCTTPVPGPDQPLQMPRSHTLACLTKISRAGTGNPIVSALCCCSWTTLGFLIISVQVYTHMTVRIITLLGGGPTTFLYLVVVKSLDFLLHVKTIPCTLCPWNMNSRIFIKKICSNRGIFIFFIASVKNDS